MGYGGMTYDRRDRDYHDFDRRRNSFTKNLPIGSVIQVKIGEKMTPAKTTIHRKGDLVEVTANGKKYLASWFMNEWIGQKI